MNAGDLQIFANELRSRREKLVRVWCAASSTGQEVYSLAILLAASGQQWRLLGTDIDTHALGVAVSGNV